MLGCLHLGSPSPPATVPWKPGHEGPAPSRPRTLSTSWASDGSGSYLSVNALAATTNAGFDAPDTTVQDVRDNDPRPGAALSCARACDGPEGDRKRAGVQGHPLASSRARPGADPDQGLRCLPHRPPRPGRRADAAQAAPRTGASDRGCGPGGVRRHPRSRPRRTRRCSLAGLHLRGMRLLPDRQGEPLRSGAVHGLRHRRGVRRGDGRGCALLLPHPRGLSRPRGRAPALRRAHRLSRVSHDRQRAAPRPLRLRLRRPHPHPSGDQAGARSLCLHARRRRDGASLRAHAGRDLGGSGRGLPPPTCWTRPSSSRPQGSWCLEPWPSPDREGSWSVREST